MKKISVIIPIYNAEKYLKQCIKSVMDQTLEDIEIICVNDGSTDNSPQIIDEFAKTDSRIVAIHKENSGYGNSMNRGIEKATGEYIGIVESDDYIDKQMYEKLFAMTHNGTVDVVKANFWDCYDKKDGTIKKVENHERKNMPKINSPFTVRDYPQILWGHPSIWTGIYRRQFLTDNNIKFKEVKGGGWVDNPFFFDTLFSAKSIRWTSTPYYCYRKTNDESSSVNYNLRLPFERMMDNFAVAEKNEFHDLEVQKNMYARALMYMVGAMHEETYKYKEDSIRPYIREMLDHMNEDVILDNFNALDQRNYFKYRSPISTLYPPAAKLLIYNWVPFDNPVNAGGGVNIYCRNLISNLLQNRPDIQIYFLSSGWAYDISKKRCYVRKISNMFGERVRSFEIVNSPVPAPQDMLFNNPTVAYENKVIYDVFDEFLEECGPFDAVHFNNIEGLSFDVLDLKKKYPDTKFVFSMHNYIPICMTGFYYMRDKHKNCYPGHSADDCEKCINYRSDNNRKLKLEITKRGTVNIPHPQRYDAAKWNKCFEFEKLDEVVDASCALEFANKATKAINENMDVVLAVSECVKRIALENGIKKELVVTDYIGTKIANYQMRKSRTDRNRRYFKLVYLGSMLDYEEKGYPFLIKALSKLDKEYASKIDITLTLLNKNRDEFLRRKLENYHKVRIIHGYTHQDLEKIMRGAHLGVVPVLWEDNLPQISIEMAALGVPVLSSDAGGASELCSSELFTFKSGDVDSFLEKLKYLVTNRDKLDEYWKHHEGLVTLDEHTEKICEYYGIKEMSEREITISLQDYLKLVEENEFLYRHLSFGHYDQNDMKNQRDYLQYCLDETRKSKSYKIGLAITALPRRLRRKSK